MFQADVQNTHHLYQVGSRRPEFKACVLIPWEARACTAQVSQMIAAKQPRHKSTLDSTLLRMPIAKRKRKRVLGMGEMMGVIPLLLQRCTHACRDSTARMHRTPAPVHWPLPIMEPELQVAHIVDEPGAHNMQFWALHASRLAACTFR